MPYAIYVQKNRNLAHCALARSKLLVNECSKSKPRGVSSIVQVPRDGPPRPQGYYFSDFSLAKGILFGNSSRFLSLVSI